MCWPQRRTSTTASSSSRCWRPTRVCVAGEGVRGGPAAGRRSCTRTRATTTRGAAATCTGGASRFGSPGAESRPRPTWAGTAGSWSDHLLGPAVQAPRDPLRPHRSHTAAVAPARRHAHQPSPTAPGDRVMRPGLTTLRYEGSLIPPAPLFSLTAPIGATRECGDKAWLGTCPGRRRPRRPAHRPQSVAMRCGSANR